MVSTRIRAALIGAASAIALLGATPAFANSHLTIVQKEPIENYGDFTLTYPNGSEIITRGQSRNDVVVSQVGTYTISVTAPDKAHYQITVADGSTVLAASADKPLSFVVGDGQTLSITITYGYEGTINVTSEPSGVVFELLGPSNIRFGGITPATFTNLPPSLYRVTYARTEGCGMKGQQSRELSAGGIMTFFVRLTCPSLPVEPAPVDEPVQTPVGDHTVRVWAVAQQAEALPGSTARFTITVKNTGDRTVHNVVVSGQYNALTLQPVTPLDRGGVVDGSTLSWEVPEILSGKYWTVTVPMTVNKNIAQGDQLTLTARVSADDLSVDGNVLVATARIGAVTSMPQTGSRFDILFLIGSVVLTSLLAVAVHKQQKA